MTSSVLGSGVVIVEDNFDRTGTLVGSNADSGHIWTGSSVHPTTGTAYQVSGDADSFATVSGLSFDTGSSYCLSVNMTIYLPISDGWTGIGFSRPTSTGISIDTVGAFQMDESNSVYSHPFNLTSVQVDSFGSPAPPSFSHNLEIILDTGATLASSTLTWRVDGSPVRTGVPVDATGIDGIFLAHGSPDNLFRAEFDRLILLGPAVPEPSSMLIFALGGLGALFRRRRSDSTPSIHKRNLKLVLGVVLLPAAATAASVTNGSFENLSSSYVDVPGADRMSNVAADGWTILANSPDWFWGEGPAGLWNTPYGDHFAIGAATGTTGPAYREGIFQTVSGFVVGETYEISFSHVNGLFYNPGSPGFYEGAGTVGGWEVLIDASSLMLAASTNPNGIPAPEWTGNWQTSSVTFVASSTTHDLQFVAYKPDGAGQDPTFQFLDDVRVQIIPEPSFPLLVGATGLLLLRRRVSGAKRGMRAPAKHSPRTRRLLATPF